MHELVYGLPSHIDTVLCIFEGTLYVLLPVSTPLTALALTRTDSYHDNLRLMQMKLDWHERELCGCVENESGTEAESETSEDEPMVLPSPSSRRHDVQVIADEITRDL